MTARSQAAMKVTDVRRGGYYILLSHLNIHCVLLGCQPKSWLTVFSGPEGELAILNPLSSIEQLVKFFSSDLMATSEWQLKPAGQKEKEE